MGIIDSFMQKRTEPKRGRCEKHGVKKVFPRLGTSAVRSGGFDSQKKICTECEEEDTKPA